MIYTIKQILNILSGSDVIKNGVSIYKYGDIINRSFAITFTYDHLLYIIHIDFNSVVVTITLQIKDLNSGNYLGTPSRTEVNDEDDILELKLKCNELYSIVKDFVDLKFKSFAGIFNKEEEVID